LAAVLIILVAMVLLLGCGSEFLNQTLIISSLTANEEMVDPSGSSQISCVARDPDRDEITYAWSASGGTISGEGPIVIWTPPDVPADHEEHTVTVRVTDSKGNRSRRKFINFNVMCACLREASSDK